MASFVASNFEFRQIDDASAQVTVAAWQEQVQKFEDLVNPAHYRMVFDWVLKLTSPSAPPDTYVYGLFSAVGGLSVAQAILVVTHARKKSDAPWLKLLSLHVSPEYDAGSEERADELGDLTAQAILNSFELTFGRHLSDMLKVSSASSALDRSFLRGLTAVLKAYGIQASMNGAWLICERPKS